jgi:CheY-like chemotaxis protein
MTIHCLIVDDNRDFLGAARCLLEAEGITVVGVATNGVEALRHVAELQPDVTLVDVNLGDEDGFDVARSISAAQDGTLSRVILISTYAEKDLVDSAPSGRALPFLSKTDLSETAIRAVLSCDS